MTAQRDFIAQLRRQLSLLENSCLAFDQGCRDEAVRIATAIRVLVHNTANSTSLITHLKAESTRLLSTCARLSSQQCIVGFDGLTACVDGEFPRRSFQAIALSCNEANAVSAGWD